MNYQFNKQHGWVKSAAPEDFKADFSESGVGDSPETEDPYTIAALNNLELEEDGGGSFGAPTIKLDPTQNYTFESPELKAQGLINTAAHNQFSKAFPEPEPEFWRRDNPMAWLAGIGIPAAGGLALKNIMSDPKEKEKENEKKRRRKTASLNNKGKYQLVKLANWKAKLLATLGIGGAGAAGYGLASSEGNIKNRALQDQLANEAKNHGASVAAGQQAVSEAESFGGQLPEWALNSLPDSWQANLMDPEKAPGWIAPASAGALGAGATGAGLYMTNKLRGKDKDKDKDKDEDA